ncbi:MAG: hypothetical protein KGL44_03520 [Sphingomonadales bacterium]|nr:hypothetical protein [Sphingomonadales bacterium]
MTKKLFLRASSAARAFVKDTSGNMVMFMGLAIVPMVFAVGFGIDYSRAMRLDTKLNAAADAAALAGVSAIMMQKSDSEALAAARVMFNKQVDGLPGLVYDASSSSNPTITINSTTGVNTSRTVTVAYNAASSNVFSGILGQDTLPIQGSATGFATRAPHINFYLMLDTSPSMLLPSTSAGLNRIRALTTSSDHLTSGCAFACHVQLPHGDNIYIRAPVPAGSPAGTKGKDIFLYGGTVYQVETVTNGYIYYRNESNVLTKGPLETAGNYADSLWAAKNYGMFTGEAPLELRVDAEQTAAEDLIPFAQQTALDNKVTYRLQMFGFGYNNPTALTASMDSVATMSSASVPDLMSQQAYWNKNNCITATNCINDQATEFVKMFNTMNSTIPTPGTGATAADPQAVMFIITDGVSDESLSGTRNNRELRAAHQTLCTNIKNRGIRIAILYTEYLPESLTGDSWSQTALYPYLSNIEPALKQCASAKADGTPLYYKVTSDESIPVALSALFSLTVSSAHLTR